MGMDVYGKNPKNKKGEYFRNSVWWWHPLWHYCETVHNDIAQKVEDGHSNSGYGLDSTDAYKLGIKLRQDCVSGLASEYERRYMAELSQLPKEKCHLCHGTGIIVKENELYVSADAESVSGSKVCHVCSGEGFTDSFNKNYPFSAENLRDFAEFCIHSGGFSIH